MSDIETRPSAAEYDTNVDAAKEDAGISEDKITSQDTDQISEDNIVDGTRSTRADVNYADADAQADKAAGAAEE